MRKKRKKRKKWVQDINKAQCRKFSKRNETDEQKSLISNEFNKILILFNASRKIPILFLFFSILFGSEKGLGE